MDNRDHQTWDCEVDSSLEVLKYILQSVKYNILKLSKILSPVAALWVCRNTTEAYFSGRKKQHAKLRTEDPESVRENPPDTVTPVGRRI